MRREFFTPVGNRVQRGARGRARLGALAVTTVLGLTVVVSAALPASATRGDGEQTGGARLLVTSTVIGGVATFTVGPPGARGSPCRCRSRPTRSRTDWSSRTPRRWPSL